MIPGLGVQVVAVTGLLHLPVRLLQQSVRPVSGLYGHVPGICRQQAGLAAEGPTSQDHGLAYVRFHAAHGVDLQTLRPIRALVQATHHALLVGVRDAFLNNPGSNSTGQDNTWHLQ